MGAWFESKVCSTWLREMPYAWRHWCWHKRAACHSIHGADALSLAADGNTAFEQALPGGALHEVTVHARSAGQLFTLSGGSGTVNAAVAAVVALCTIDLC